MGKERKKLQLWREKEEYVYILAKEWYNNQCEWKNIGQVV